MNVLIISHTYIAPINREKWKTCARLHPDLFLTVVMPQQWPTHLFEHSAHDEMVDERCQFKARATFFAGNEVRYCYLWDDLARIIIEVQPDVIHVEQGDHAMSYLQAIVMARLLGFRPQNYFFTWINWKPQRSWHYAITWGLVARINRWLSSGAIVGNHDAHVILSELAFAKPIMQLPQIGVDPALFLPAITTYVTRTIGYIGRIAFEKGVLDLLAAFRACYEDDPSLRLLIVGKGPAQNAVNDYLHEHNLSHVISIEPPVDHYQVVDVFARIDVLVLPSYDTLEWREQFGHILIEAMAARKAIVASDAGQIPQVVGDAGIIFKQRNILALQQSLSAVMSDEQLRHDLAQRAYDRVMNYYTHEQIARSTYAFWKQMRSF